MSKKFAILDCFLTTEIVLNERDNLRCLGISITIKDSLREGWKVEFPSRERIFRHLMRWSGKEEAVLVVLQLAQVFVQGKSIRSNLSGQSIVSCPSSLDNYYRLRFHLEIFQRSIYDCLYTKINFLSLYFTHINEPETEIKDVAEFANHLLSCLYHRGLT